LTHFTTDFPPSAQPCSVLIQSHDQVTLLGSNTHSTEPPPTLPAPTPSSLEQAFLQLNPLDQWAVSSIKCTDEGDSVASLIRQGEAIAVSDGSHGSGISTSSFTITSRKRRDEKSTCLIDGTNAAPGSPDDQDAYRGEASGVFGIATSLEMVCTVHSISEGSIEIALDGESAMNAIFAETDPKPESPCFDLIMSARQKIKALPIKVTGRHIKGHQDKHVSFHCLDRWSQLNVRMDAQAKNLLCQLLSQGHQSVPAPFGN
jgi:hypothetical protein